MYCFQADRNQHLRSRKSFLKIKSEHHDRYSEQFSLQPNDFRLSKADKLSGNKNTVKNKSVVKSVISNPTEGRFIERPTNDLQGLVQLLKSQKETPHPNEEESQRRDSSTNGNQLRFKLQILTQ